MRQLIIRATFVATCAVIAVLLTSGPASALTPEACEHFGGLVGLRPATVTQQPDPYDINKVGMGQCVCHHNDPAIDQQPVWGLVYLEQPAGSPFHSGFYQCTM
ncbi:hypothetical protein [Nocardia sp. NPDC004860]|uniref:hypothetical protein n=1 Tax=Nocardia sp. NPDC004860 TaxID=3154557 RepID=UPI0033B43D26